MAWEIEIVSLLVCCVLGLTPAFIAGNKGERFFPWWVYGTFLFPVAMLHALYIKEKRGKTCDKKSILTAEILIKYEELWERGILTEEEFQQIKKQILEEN